MAGMKINGWTSVTYIAIDFLAILRCFQLLFLCGVIVVVAMGPVSIVNANLISIVNMLSTSSHPLSTYFIHYPHMDTHHF